MAMEILEDLFKSITTLDMAKAKTLTQATLNQGIDPTETINKAIRPALDFVGERYQTGEIFLPELMIAAKTTEAAISILSKGGYVTEYHNAGSNKVSVCRLVSKEIRYPRYE